MDQASADTFESLAGEIIALCAGGQDIKCRLIERVRRFDAFKPWDDETPDCAHWLVPSLRYGHGHRPRNRPRCARPR